ncbi:MAG: hypothetical protein JST75_00245 [Bacteroidetes bacterium]|nr:hypothetical protein [Bacteroidota bacterium]
MKKNLIFSVCLLALGVSSYASPSVDDKVIKSFKETFPGAQEVKWEEFSDNYVVNFVDLGMRERISYDKEGNFINATRYYNEGHLPLNILFRLRKKYPTQKIFGVTEIESDVTIEYYIKLEDDNNWITLKSDNGANLQVIEKYKKAEEK